MANSLTHASGDEFGGAIVHQALHGYSDGHRLLESSLHVPDDLRRLMLRMSDRSGSSVRGGFEDYLTGYPLASLNAYALAKTWYAPEMPRPGCVWTHTLIIPASTMMRISSLGALETLFQRPTNRGPRVSYSQVMPLTSLHNDSHVVDQQPSSMSIGTMIVALSGHYGDPNAPLLFAAEKVHEFDELIFAIWSQKWPALRMTFTFCTGSLSNRTFDNRPLDFQVVPMSVLRGVSHEIAASGVTGAKVANSLQADATSWAVTAAHDAMCTRGSELRRFLWAVSDSTSGRPEFTRFVKVFGALKDRVSIPNFIASVAELFPEPSDGRHLKTTLFGDPSVRAEFLDCEEFEVLLGLATTDFFRSFDASELGIPQRVLRLSAVRQSVSSLVGQLFRASLNPLGEELLSGLLSTLDSETAVDVATQDPQFLSAIFRANPSLASFPALWRVAGDRQREVFEALADNDHVDAALARRIVSTLLETGSEAFIRRAFDLWGRAAVWGCLDWIDKHPNEMSETCRAALGLQVPHVLAWIESQPSAAVKSLIAVAHIVAPYANSIARHDATVWLQLFRDVQNSTAGFDNDEGQYISTFLLALGLSNAPPSPLDLVSESFERVHEAAGRDRLSDNAWIVVEPFVPQLNWWKNWDKCERLRRGLISAFVHHGWPPEELWRRVSDRGLVEQLLRSAREVRGGREYFRNLA
jgi:hypothetical protein